MEPVFDHEKLVAYQNSLKFIEWTESFLSNIPKQSSVHNQLERASTSITLNIAEGNAKWSKRDRCRYFDIAHGSAVECAAALDVAVGRGFIDSRIAHEGKTIAVAVVRLLVGLI